MKLKFKEQSYQVDAVNAVVDCFKGQSKQELNELIPVYYKVTNKGTLFEETMDFVSFANSIIKTTDLEIRNNIRNVQQRNDIDIAEQIRSTRDFTIEMETGTGKTYTYIKTMYELNEKYGWSKFIIMVPSIAIREGVLKTFQITEEHFQERYKKKIRYFVYNSNNSSNIANINSFASENSIQAMIINYQAFSAKGKANRRIFEELDELASNRPIDIIKSVRPILIIDEPQKFGDKTESLFEEFNPLFTIRYSATHKKNKEYNKVYRLDAIDAFNKKLVKRINVKGIEVLNNKSEDTYMYLESVNISDKHDPEAVMEIDVKTSSGTKRKFMKIKNGDDLYVKSGELIAYKNYVVSEIDARYEDYDKVFFTNGKEIKVGQAVGDVEDDYITRIQIRETIKSHFEKEINLFEKGIKVLSLFFIDEVAKYKDWSSGSALKGKYALIFEEEYNKVLEEYIHLAQGNYKKYLKTFDTGKIHAGYFSVDKKGREIDSKMKKNEESSFDEDAYNLIMKDKERLLSFEEPVRFIFSHSALREGWDNPNIFQICTLKHSNSEISKRQEIGRGLRICVNKNGERQDKEILDKDFYNINTLTVVASESYESFAESLQNEIMSSLTEKSLYFNYDLFKGREFSKNGEWISFDQPKFFDLLFMYVGNGYVNKDKDYMITNKLINDLKSDKLEVTPELEPFKDEFLVVMKRLFMMSDTKITKNEFTSNIPELKLNDNFKKKEFQDLWNRINTKTIYEVSFNSEELINKCVKAINSRLTVPKMNVRITEGSQKENIKDNSLMEDKKIKIETYDDFVPSKVKYDLINEITKATGLTRKTIVAILSKIDKEKFNVFSYNPEIFLRKVGNIINDEKASAVVEGIVYYKTEQKYSNDIFMMNNIYGELGNNALDVKKHIYNYLIYDSDNEMKFAKELEGGEVKVYAKLPNGFKIPTPVGNYNPDWAIVFDNDKFRYVYFIAETKGSLRPDELRGSEKAKIECAREHFKSLSEQSVKYDVVDSYETLINLVA